MYPSRKAEVYDSSHRQRMLKERPVFSSPGKTVAYSYLDFPDRPPRRVRWRYTESATSAPAREFGRLNRHLARCSSEEYPRDLVFASDLYKVRRLRSIGNLPQHVEFCMSCDRHYVRHTFCLCSVHNPAVVISVYSDTQKSRACMSLRDSWCGVDTNHCCTFAP